MRWICLLDESVEPAPASKQEQRTATTVGQVQPMPSNNGSETNASTLAFLAFHFFLDHPEDHLVCCRSTTNKQKSLASCQHRLLLFLSLLEQPCAGKLVVLDQVSLSSSFHSCLLTNLAACLSQRFGEHSDKNSERACSCQ